MRAFVAFAVLLLVGCEPEIGGLCDPDKAKVTAAVEVNAGTNNLVQDVGLNNCTESFCLSTDGSRPYCTKRCEADIECAEAGAGFTCQVVINFGPLACSDFEDPTHERPGATSTAAACAANGDCTTQGEVCLADQCTVPGRDCVTGAAGGPSDHPLKYCAASPDVIKARDKQYNR